MEKMPPEKEFNLLDEPWILVKLPNNEVREWSLLEVFQHAHEAQQLAGELPTQDIAVMRLLLAIMHGAFITEDIDDAEMALGCWKEMWEEKQFMYDIVEAYLERYRERFWLFHPQYPFYQVADLKRVMDEYRKANVKGYKVKEEEKLKPVARLIGELFQSEHAPRLFPLRTGQAQDTLAYAEAARWLLHLNGFDDDSAKKPTPKGVGYLGQLGLIYAQGKNLFETLMLNFVLLDDRNEVFADHETASKAYWEKPVCTKIENLINQPSAQKDLLTLQSRRILLRREAGKVVGYLLTMGDYFDKAQGLLNETMTVWKKDEKTGGIVPKLHKPDRQLWRDFSALLAQAEGNENNRNAGIIHWLQVLEESNLLPQCTVQICVAGGHYRLQGAGWQIVDYLPDALEVRAVLFKKLNAAWIDEIIRVLSLTDQAVLSLGWLAADAAAADGNSSKDARQALAQKAREDCYHRMDGTFRDWLIVLDPQQDEPDEKMAEWLKTAKHLILQCGEQVLDDCSEKAMTGYIKRDEKNKTEVMNAFKAFHRFTMSVGQILGKEGHDE